MRLFLLIGTILLGAAAPALAEPALAEEAASAPATDANLFIYRVHAEPLVWAPTVKIDGQKVVAIGQKQYTAIHLAPGRHDIQLAWPIFSGQKGKKGSITIVEGENLYLEVTGVSRVAGIVYGGYQFLMGSGLTPHQDATAEIASCCEFKPPKD